MKPNASVCKMNSKRLMILRSLVLLRRHSDHIMVSSILLGLILVRAPSMTLPLIAAYHLWLAVRKPHQSYRLLLLLKSHQSGILCMLRVLMAIIKTVRINGSRRQTLYLHPRGDIRTSHLPRLSLADKYIINIREERLLRHLVSFLRLRQLVRMDGGHSCFRLHLSLLFLLLLHHFRFLHYTNSYNLLHFSSCLSPMFLSGILHHFLTFVNTILPNGSS